MLDFQFVQEELGPSLLGVITLGWLKYKAILMCKGDKKF